MTTRKTLSLLAALTGVALGGAGCATPGPLHVYAIEARGAPGIHDIGGPMLGDVPNFLGAGDTLTGFAYDPFTDHFFLRLAPGNKMLVVDRPARAIKREFAIEGAPPTGGGDLTVRPASGHLYLLHPDEPAIIETDRLGKHARTFRLGQLAAPARGVAYDARSNELLILDAGEPARVSVHDLNGTFLRSLGLERAVGPSLAFDAEKREIYAPLAAGQLVAVFDEKGKFLRTLEQGAIVVDVGPRSFLRVF